MFFNKSKFIASKLSDAIEIKQNVAFSIPIFIIDAITYFSATTINVTLVKVDGRNITQLPTVLTVVTTGFTSTISGTISNTDWDGVSSLNLHILADGNFIDLPLVVKV